jgi:hypothetical protein
MARPAANRPTQAPPSRHPMVESRCRGYQAPVVAGHGRHRRSPSPIPESAQPAARIVQNRARTVKVVRAVPDAQNRRDGLCGEWQPSRSERSRIYEVAARQQKDASGQGIWEARREGRGRKEEGGLSPGGHQNTDLRKVLDEAPGCRTNWRRLWAACWGRILWLSRSHPRGKAVGGVEHGNGSGRHEMMCRSTTYIGTYLANGTAVLSEEREIGRQIRQGFGEYVLCT